MKTNSLLLLQIAWGTVFLIGCIRDESISPITTATATNTRIPASISYFTPTPEISSSIFQPQNASELQDYVILNLNQGKTIKDIDSSFASEDRKRAWVQGSEVDFDGDNESELLMITSLYFENQDNIENSFWIAKKIQGQYTIVISKRETAFYPPKIELIDDFNNDNLPDLVFTRVPFGNGAGADIFIARYENPDFIIHHIGQTDLIIDKIWAEPQGENSAKNLMVIGFESGWGSSGSGRTIEETYHVATEEYLLLHSRLLPDKYRIHVLQDAQIAYDAGDEELAVKLWEHAAYDQSLENFPSMWIDDDIPEKYQPAFAVYRLYTYYLSINDSENAQKYWAELNANYPPDSPGGEFIALANEAKRLLGSSRDPVVVCDGIYEFLNSTPENVDFLINHWYWGDHNLNIVEFCPLRR